MKSQLSELLWMSNLLLFSHNFCNNHFIIAHFVMIPKNPCGFFIEKPYPLQLYPNFKIKDWVNDFTQNDGSIKFQDKTALWF